MSRDSSHDGLLDDCDRLSTASVTSESSVSHRLNDVQDVQDLARMQEESKLLLVWPLQRNISLLDVEEMRKRM